MNIYSSKDLNSWFGEISKQCRQSGEPIYLSNNGALHLVLVSSETFEKQLARLNIKERLLDIELEQSRGVKTYSLDELNAALSRIVG